MSWGIVAVTAVSAVGAGISASQANKSRKSQMGAFDDAIAYAEANPGAFGFKPEFEEIDYEPLFRQDPGYANIAGDAIRGNQRNFGDITGLVSDTNEFIDQDALNRIEGLYPGFLDTFGMQQRNTDAMLAGVIPFEDMQGITGRRAEAISLGGGGFGGQQTAADLGLTRLQLMQAGQAALAANIDIANAVNPIERRLTPQSLFVDPTQAIQLAVGENQFDATFAANERNAAFNASMTPDPQLAGRLNLLAARGGAQAAVAPQQSVLGNALMAGAQTYLTQSRLGQTGQAAPRASSGAQAVPLSQGGYYDPTFGVEVRRAIPYAEPVVGAGTVYDVGSLNQLYAN
jgi:hypothetical protein